jgi:hypothetical protein
MPGVPRELAEHKLKVYPQARPIRQKLRCFTPDKREAIQVELARLVSVGFIRKVLHPEWLANPILVLRKNKVDWRMCVDYTCWGLVLKCYELRIRQHKMLVVKELRPSKHYLPKDIMIFRRRL